jgi:7-cyano-7-deazaguanine synthase
MKKAIILLSGGLDSATVAAIAINQGFTLHAVSFSYGQKHHKELEHAKLIRDYFKINSTQIISLQAEIFATSSLIGNKKIAKNRDLAKSEIPNTYVPARNIIFLSYALALAESFNIYDIFIGVNAVDYSGYPDCRPEFIENFTAMANAGTKLGQFNKIKIHTPLINLTKAEIIKIGLELNLDYSITHSCYDPINDYSCGACDACLLRLRGFKENNLQDPIRYA